MVITIYMIICDIPCNYEQFINNCMGGGGGGGRGVACHLVDVGTVG